jgi:UMF1 family MFS transporter
MIARFINYLKSPSGFLVGWLAYDFANSPFTTIIITFIYATFYVEVVVGDTILGTQMWSWVIGGSSIVIAILAPIIGRSADRHNNPVSWLCLTSVSCALLCFVLYFFNEGQYLWAGIVVGAANIAFELSCAIYNALIINTPNREKLGQISAFGWASGWTGGLLALTIALIFFVFPEQPIFGLDKAANEHIRSLSLLVGLWYLVFMLPTLIHFSSKQNNKRKLPQVSAARLSLKELIKRFPNLWKFFLARLFYNDGLVTVFSFGGIYAMGTFNFSFTEVLIFGIVLNISALLGSLALSKLDDNIGSKKAIMLTLVGLMISIVLAILAPNNTIFWLAGVLTGFFCGPNQCMSRAFVVKLSDPAVINETFGWFAFIGKSTSFFGPFIVGLTTVLFSSQRIGLIVIFVLYLLGLLLLSKVDDIEY